MTTRKPSTEWLDDVLRPVTQDDIDEAIARRGPREIPAGAFTYVQVFPMPGFNLDDMIGWIDDEQDGDIIEVESE